jgi:hypothetical protein
LRTTPGAVEAKTRGFDEAMLRFRLDEQVADVASAK